MARVIGSTAIAATVVRSMARPASYLIFLAIGYCDFILAVHRVWEEVQDGEAATPTAARAATSAS
jgi:hypothetical protein